MRTLLADLSQVWPEANQHFSKEIDDEANSYFQRIYNHPPHPTMSVDEVRQHAASSHQEFLLQCVTAAELHTLVSSGHLKTWIKQGVTLMYNEIFLIPAPLSGAGDAAKV